MVRVTADSLLVRCGVAAALYYLPQDLGVLSLLWANKNSTNARLTGPKLSGPPEEKVDNFVFNFMSDRNFTPATYMVTKKRNFTVVDLLD